MALFVRVLLNKKACSRLIWDWNRFFFLWETGTSIVNMLAVIYLLGKLLNVLSLLKFLFFYRVKHGLQKILERPGGRWCLATSQSQWNGENIFVIRILFRKFGISYQVTVTQPAKVLIPLSFNRKLPPHRISPIPRNSSSYCKRSRVLNEWSANLVFLIFMQLFIFYQNFNKWSNFPFFCG